MGRTTKAVTIAKRCIESRCKKGQSKETPGNSLVRLSPSMIINSTQYDCTGKMKLLLIR